VAIEIMAKTMKDPSPVAVYLGFNLLAKLWGLGPRAYSGEVCKNILHETVRELFEASNSTSSDKDLGALALRILLKVTSVLQPISEAPLAGRYLYEFTHQYPLLNVHGQVEETYVKLLKDTTCSFRLLGNEV